MSAGTVTGELRTIPERGWAVADLPLGPWAGSVLRVWTAKPGGVEHADPDCPLLKGAGQEAAPYEQPAAGTLGDRVLSGDLHCSVPDERSAYLTAAHHLVARMAELNAAEDRLLAGHLPLDLCKTARAGLPMLNGQPQDAATAELERPELAPWVERLDARRARLATAVLDQLGPHSERLALMLAAAWVRGGRTPRQHQPRYAEFLGWAEEEFACRGISASQTGMRPILNDLLPAWLNEVATGGCLSAATEAMADRWPGRHADADLAQRVREAFLAVGRGWERMLAGVVLAHPGTVVAVFGWAGVKLPWGVREAVLASCTHARVRAGHLSWVVALLPAVFAAFLDTEDGRAGHVLLSDERGNMTARFSDPDRCALLLRDLLRAAGLQRCAKAVEAQAGTHWHLRGRARPLGEWLDGPPVPYEEVPRFADDIGIGFHYEDCLPALRAAF